MPSLTTVAATAAIVATAAATYDTSREAFASWMTKHGKVYATESAREVAYRHFTKNAAVAAEMKRRNPHANFGATRFADRAVKFSNEENPHHEVVAQKRAAEAQAATDAPIVANVIPAFVDWRAQGGVSPVGDEGQCGSGGPAFAIAANIEGVNFATTRHFSPVSVEEIIACAVGNCNGMTIAQGIDWLEQHASGAIATAASWPYNSSAPVKTCAKEGIEIGAVIEATVSLRKSEKVMAESLARNGPIGVIVDAGNTAWELYDGGVVSNCPRTSGDQGVAVVGYKDDAAVPYWIVKNSWGTDWGENGYIMIAKGSDQCGIASFGPWSVTTRGNGSEFVHTPAPVPTFAPVPQPEAKGKWLGIGLAGGVVGGVVVGSLAAMAAIILTRPKDGAKTVDVKEVGDDYVQYEE